MSISFCNDVSHASFLLQVSYGSFRYTDKYLIRHFKRMVGPAGIAKTTLKSLYGMVDLAGIRTLTLKYSYGMAGQSGTGKTTLKSSYGMVSLAGIGETTLKSSYGMVGLAGIGKLHKVRWCGRLTAPLLTLTMRGTNVIV